jgi:hypothetical protein
MLSAEELLAGSALSFEVEVPAEVLHPGLAGAGEGGPGRVKLRPLTVQDLQVISRAAKESDSLVATLLVQRALLEPQMTVAQVAAMRAGLVHFLVEQVNRISGITTAAEQLANAMEAPLARAAFLLAKEFGWTPQQVSELTLGQILLNLQMVKESQRRAP